MDGEMLMCDDNIPIDVSELGELLLAEEIIPAVYYLAVEPDGTAPLEEYYLLLDGAPLSKEALRYGVPLRNGQGLVVALSPEDAGSKVIQWGKRSMSAPFMGQYCTRNTLGRCLRRS